MASDNSQWKIDVDAMIPKPIGIITIKKKDYPVWSAMDLELPKMIEVLSADEIKLESADKRKFAEHIEVAKEQILQRCPTLTIDVLMKLTGTQLISVYQKVMGVVEAAENPPVGSETGSQG